MQCWVDHRKAKKQECEHVLREVPSLGKRITDWKKIKWQVETIKIQEARENAERLSKATQAKKKKTQK